MFTYIVTRATKVSAQQGVTFNPTRLRERFAVYSNSVTIMYHTIPVSALNAKDIYGHQHKHDNLPRLLLVH